MMKKIYGPNKKDKDDFENFEIPQHTQKIHMPYFVFLLYSIIFH